MPPNPRQGQAASGGALSAALTRIRRHGLMLIDDEGEAFVVDDAAQCHRFGSIVQMAHTHAVADGFPMKTAAFKSVKNYKICRCILLGAGNIYTTP